MKEQSDICCKDIIAGELVEQIKTAFSSLGNIKGLCRFEVKVDELVLLDWLAAQKSNVRIYWSNREGTFEAAGIGIADAVADNSSSTLTDALTRIEDDLTSAESKVRYYGGICFDCEQTTTEFWQGFGRFYFVVPKFELRRENGETRFAFNAALKSSDTEEAIINELISSLGNVIFSNTTIETGPFVTIKALSRTDLPEKSEWKKNILCAVNDLETKNMKKIVLCRKTVFETAEDVDAVALLGNIKKNNIKTYDFCFQVNDSNAFIGCSPECLYKKDGSSIYSEAVAGTCPAGKTDEEQKSFQDELLRSPKESEEHKYVFDDVKAGLKQICSRTHILNERDILSLSNVQHFCSRFRGVLKDNIRTCDIIEALHPTAAVNGFPKEGIKEELKKYEPFCRGWYTGLIGWIGKDSSEFAVGIRSGVVKGKQICLFAGAGIVKGSQAEQEWDETENKLTQFLKVIG